MNNNDILISIVIPCYNHGLYIDEAIQSVEAYKGNNYELIIINDGSTDDYTNKRLTELKEKGYNIIFQKNQGLGKTRNNAIKLAKGKYILPLDADNKITPDYIIKAIEILEKDSEISIVYSDRQLFGNSDEIIKVGDFNLEKILDCNYIDACAIFRKSVWVEIDGYDENMPAQGLEDWDFWLSSIEKGYRFYYIPEPLFWYRLLDNSMLISLNRNSIFNVLIKYITKKHIHLYGFKLTEDVFELKERLIRLNDEVITLRNSKAYRIGKIVLRPFSFFKMRMKL